ncbi:hypothetical protein KVMX100_170223 [Klebsiella variicola]|nr:hypothetical protein KVMX100_170223 [Klebsiella variicola]
MFIIVKVKIEFLSQERSLLYLTEELGFRRGLLPDQVSEGPPESRSCKRVISAPALL